jgi:hypothetical protein
MNFDFNDVLDELDDSPFEEKPVSPEEFIYSKEYLGLPPLSDYQMALVKAGTQIYRRETLDEYLTPSEAQLRWEQTYQEVIMVLGKGSGKDYCSTIICVYIVYLLMCLKDPQDYYGKPPGDYIDLMNIAVNAAQATNVFFKGLKERLKHSPWFENKYDPTSNEILFEKNIRLISGHSKSESLEGYNVMIVILDEISGFDDEGTNSTKQITADSTYAMHSNSVLSRFDEDGKLILLSFPRHRNCFISRRYREVVDEVEVIPRSDKIILDETIPEAADTPGNTILVEWDEDHIISYKEQNVFALKRPSWEVNPRKSIQGYRKGFVRDHTDALSRFACMPPESVNAFFKDRQAVEDAFKFTNGIDDNGQFVNTFLPEEGKSYYMHVDLAQKHDRCVVTMAHVDRWSQRVDNEFTQLNSGVRPIVKVDLVKYWKPTSTEMVDFGEVRDFIVAVRNRGFNLKLVTFDQYRSEDFIIYLNKIGIKSERLASGNNQYYIMADLFADRRVLAPGMQLAVDEYLQLRANPTNGKIDHPSKGSDDLAVCIAGACYNAVTYTDRVDFGEIEIETYTTLHQQVPNLEAELPNNVIKAPSRKVPKGMQPELYDLLMQARVI